ncbi:MAG: GNAT family protein [Pacificimonas sp.]|jgi:RimJ/RimL family protein N-acetyltransferase|nr:GNAT family protein [Pacificimonas sp.]
MFMLTERLFLRPLWPEDADALAEKLSVRDVAWNLGSVPIPYARKDAEAKIAADWAAWPMKVSLAIFLRTEDGPAYVGGIGFDRHSELKGLPEMGYWIAKPYWGRGIAAEAGEAVLEHAFLAWQLPVIGAGHYFDNPASGRVLGKLGFRATGEILAYPSVPRGCDVDSVEYQLTRTDWLARRGYAAPCVEAAKRRAA